MGAKYWLKLYHEMLDDPKVMTLTPDLRWRFIETLLVAGEMDEDGYLPDIQSYAWRVRDNVEIVETEFIELGNIGLLSRDNGRWFVTKFAERQSPISAAERMRRMRTRQKRDEYYSDVTPKLPQSDESVTFRNIDKRRVDKEEEEIPLPTCIKEAMEHPDILIFYEVTDFWPGKNDYEYVIQAMQILKNKHDNLVEYLKPYWVDWIGRKTQNGRPYKKTNPGWLQWAINGYMPPQAVKDKPLADKLKEQGYEHRSAT